MEQVSEWERENTWSVYQLNSKREKCVQCKDKKYDIEIEADNVEYRILVYKKKEKTDLIFDRECY